MDVQSCLVVWVEGPNHLGEPVGMAFRFLLYLLVKIPSHNLLYKSAVGSGVHLLQTVL